MSAESESDLTKMRNGRVYDLGLELSKKDIKRLTAKIKEKFG
mgnify:CR=1 FL=1